MQKNRSMMTVKEVKESRTPPYIPISTRKYISNFHLETRSSILLNPSPNLHNVVHSTLHKSSLSQPHKIINPNNNSRSSQTLHLRTNQYSGNPGSTDSLHALNPPTISPRISYAAPGLRKRSRSFNLLAASWESLP